MAFVSGFMKFSGSDLACGQRGVILLCLTPLSFKLVSLELVACEWFAVTAQDS